MEFDNALDLFQRTLATERSRPDVHAAMLALALPTPSAQRAHRSSRPWPVASGSG